MNNNLTATLKYALVSDKKMAIIAKLVTWKKVEDALTQLHLLPKKWAKSLHKVIKSAYSNATQNGNMDGKTLYIKSINVWRAPKLKRIRFTSRSRVSHYVRFRCFVKVILDNKKS